jgi:hypothetical protein
VDVCVKHVVADHFHSKSVVLFKDDSVIDQLYERLVGGECELLLFG